MTNVQRARFKSDLLEKRQELGRRIHAGTAGHPPAGESEHDPADQLEFMNQRDGAATLLDRLCNILSDIDASLQAVSDGCYGLCVACDEPIAFKRLEVIPWASHCIRCQQHLESTNGSRRAA